MTSKDAPQLFAPLSQAYRLMRRRHGHQKWWPGDTPFEICVGAILTQNTNWRNVERAIRNLKLAGALNPHSAHRLPESELAALIRPAGYFNVKARRLRAFLDVLVGQFDGDLRRMFTGGTPVVRARLLEINGIGPETADSMLLYAGGHLSFVIDAYTRRIFHRHRWCGADADYAGIQALCQRTLRRSSPKKCLDYWQDYHAQLVMIGKDYCRPKNPRCAECPLKSLLP